MPQKFNLLGLEDFHADVRQKIKANVPGYAQVQYGSQPVSIHPGIFGGSVFTGAVGPSVSLKAVRDAVIDWKPNMQHSDPRKSEGISLFSDGFLKAKDFRHRADDLDFADSIRVEASEDIDALQRALRDYADKMT